MKVVVSEDSPHNTDMYRLLIAGLGCQVSVATSECRTLELTRVWRPHIVITDNQKARDNSSGLRMTETLARETALAEVVVIMASADPIEAAFLWSGGDHFAHKPRGALNEVGRLIVEYLASCSCAPHGGLEER